MPEVPISNAPFESHIGNANDLIDATTDTSTSPRREQVRAGSIVSGAGLKITTAVELTPGTNGTPFSLAFAAEGGVGSYTFRHAFGTLPSGLSLASTGVLNGTPDTTETQSFGVEVSDELGAHTTRFYTLEIAAGE